MAADVVHCPWCSENLYGSSDELTVADSRPAFGDLVTAPGGMGSLYHPWCWTEYESTLLPD